MGGVGDVGGVRNIGGVRKNRQRVAALAWARATSAALEKTGGVGALPPAWANCVGGVGNVGGVRNNGGVGDGMVRRWRGQGQHK